MDYALIAFGVGCVLVACAVLTACDWMFFAGITLAIVGLFIIAGLPEIAA